MAAARPRAGAVMWLSGSACGTSHFRTGSLKLLGSPTLITFGEANNYHNW
jgi:hypothetical protein